MVHDMTNREQWLAWMLRIGKPVLESLAERKLKEQMPVQGKLGIEASILTWKRSDDCSSGWLPGWSWPV